MASVTRVHALDHVAQILGEDLEMLEEIVSNDDNLSYGNIIRVHTGTDEAVTAITDHGIEEPRSYRGRLSHRRSQLAAAPPWPARSSAQHEPFSGGNSVDKHRFVDDPDILARVKENGPR